tara:strand:- start:1039 stop:1467 length:429 start_codon:yes stop_codon:yes gene_type:complete
MIGLYLIFSFLAAVTMAGLCYLSIRNYRVYKTNLQVEAELNKIINSTLETIQKNKDDLTENAKEEDLDVFTSPDMMSAIITVIVNKLGTLRLSMQDFIIAGDEVVSVYVDTETQEIILSLNHNLNSNDLLVGFKAPPDNTFH